MKNLLSLLCILTSYINVLAQEHSNPASSDKYYIAFYTPASAWNKSKPANEQEHFNEHSAHLSGLRKAGKIDIGGRYSNTALILVKAKSAEEAESLLQNDPAIRNELFEVEIFSFTPFYNGCVR
jgi:uncharacterized protein YciI